MTDDIRIIHGDCLDVLPTLESGSVDAIVTDPPFGVRKESWDSMGDHEYARFCMSWLTQARRISPELVVFCNQDHIIRDLCRTLYANVREMIWFKPPGSQYAGGRECGVWFAYEVILHCHNRETWSVVQPKDAAVGRLIKAAREIAGMSRSGVDIAVRGKKTGLCYRWEEGACLPTSEQVARLQVILGLGDEFLSALAEAKDAKAETVHLAREEASANAARAIDVFSHRTVTKGCHPCEKPVPLMIDLIKAVGTDYKTILDPFAGSGSTLVACMKTGRRGIGIEIDAKYIPVIERRVRAAETPLFTDAS